METIEAPIVLMRTNQPDGFDCGCAWPDKEHKSTFQFCENGAKAVTWEATTKRVTPEFFAANTVSSLLRMSDYELENMGRLTHPLVYDRATDTFRAIEWDDAFARIGEVLRALPPDQANSIRPAARRTKPRTCTSCSRANSAPTTSPTARTCATSRPASACRSRSASARAPCRWRISTTAS